MIFVEFMLIVGCFGLLFVGLLFELFVFVLIVGCFGLLFVGLLFELFVVYVGAVDEKGGTAPL